MYVCVYVCMYVCMCNGITIQQTNSDRDPVADLVDGDVGEVLASSLHGWWE